MCRYLKNTLLLCIYLRYNTSPYSHHVNQGISYILRPASFAGRVLHDVFCLLVTPVTLAGQKFFEVKNQVMITCAMSELCEGCSKILRWNCSE